jgi:hypothetical protein
MNGQLQPLAGTAAYNDSIHTGALFFMPCESQLNEMGYFFSLRDAWGE